MHLLKIRRIKFVTPKLFAYNVSDVYRRFATELLTLATFGSTPDPGGRPYGEITCPNLKMDITIELLVIKIPGVSIFSNLCRFAIELLTLTTFGSMPGPGIWPFDLITSSNLKMNVTVRFLVQHLPKVPFCIIPCYIVSGFCAHKQFWANWGFGGRVTS